MKGIFGGVLTAAGLVALSTVIADHGSGWLVVVFVTIFGIGLEMVIEERVRSAIEKFKRGED